MSLFFVDNNCDLGNELIGKMSIECIDFPYLLDGKVMTFDYDYSKLVSKSKKLLKIEALELSKENYVSIFKQCFDRGDDVIYLYASEKIFNTKNLTDAKTQLEQLYPDRKLLLIDSCSFSIGQGLISYDIAMQYRNGATISEIEEYSYKIKNEYALYLTVDTANTLVDNGLVPSTMVAGASLSVKPILTIDFDGSFQLVEKVSGKKRAVSKMVDYIRQYGSNVADYPIGIVYSDNETQANELREKVVEYFGEEAKILMGRFSPSNLSIVGVGAIGICFHVKKKSV
ncbi:MAG: DegV family EDD domain-containing protein [Clostridiales bacterium]|nr:DegV family EDD domain-containing protein [Clostridiales bacterium]